LGFRLSWVMLGRGRTNPVLFLYRLPVALFATVLIDDLRGIRSGNVTVRTNSN
jgi:hypothetical protein